MLVVLTRHVHVSLYNVKCVQIGNCPICSDLPAVCSCCDLTLAGTFNSGVYGFRDFGFRACGSVMGFGVMGFRMRSSDIHRLHAHAKENSDEDSC